MTINISLALPLSLRLRLFVERLLAATGPDAERHFEADRRFNEITRNQDNLGLRHNFLGLNKNVTANVDLGQFQSAFKHYTLLDDEGKTIKFNSMVAAMNYMGERGWKFIQAYIVTEGVSKTFIIGLCIKTLQSRVKSMMDYV